MSAVNNINAIYNTAKAIQASSIIDNNKNGIGDSTYVGDLIKLGYFKGEKVDGEGWIDYGYYRIAILRDYERGQYGVSSTDVDRLPSSLGWEHGSDSGFLVICELRACLLPNWVILHSGKSTMMRIDGTYKGEIFRRFMMNMEKGMIVWGIHMPGNYPFAPWMDVW